MTHTFKKHPHTPRGGEIKKKKKAEKKNENRKMY